MYLLISEEDQHGRKKDPLNDPDSTMMFWEKQKTESPEAYNELFSPEKDNERVSLSEALHQTSKYIDENTPKNTKPQVMGNGPEFDNVILSHAYEQLGITQPWKFSGNQSLRTACLFGRLFLGIDPKYTLERSGPLHHALHDAIHETQYLLEITNLFIDTLATAVTQNKDVVAIDEPQTNIFKHSLMKALGHTLDKQIDITDLLKEVEFNKKALHDGEASMN